MFGERELAPVVAAVHAADLGDGDVGFVGEDDGVVGDEFEEGGGRFAGGATGEVAGVVFDAVAGTRGLEHFEVEVGALFEALGFEQFAFVDELVEALAEFLLDGLDGLLERRAGRDVVGVGVDADAVEAVRLGAGEGVEFGDGFQFFAEEGEAPGAILKVGGPDFERIAADTEAAALKA